MHSYHDILDYDVGVEKSEKNKEGERREVRREENGDKKGKERDSKRKRIFLFFFLDFSFSFVIFMFSQFMLFFHHIVGFLLR